MAEKAVPRETVRALRDAIARLERGTGTRATERAGEEAGFGRPPLDPAATVLREEGISKARAEPVLPIGVPALDEALAGGLPLRGMTEIRVSETRDAGAGIGFTLALAALCQARRREGGELGPVLWIAEGMALKEAGAPYGVGLAGHGLDLSRALLSGPRSLKEALWIAEAALNFSVFAAVVLEMRGNPAALGFQESRRLQVRARAGSVPLLLVRQAGEEEASGALFRLAVLPAPAAARLLPDGRPLAGSIGNPVFHVVAEKSRAFAPVDAYLEWSAHERRFYPLAPLGSLAPVDAQPVSPGAAHPVAPLSASADGSDRAGALGAVVAFKRAS